jgi:hypothetical protein
MYSTVSEQNSETGSCEEGDEPSGTTESEKFYKLDVC